MTLHEELIQILRTATHAMHANEFAAAVDKTRPYKTQIWPTPREHN